MPKLCLYSEQLSCDARELDERLFELIGIPRPNMGYIPSAATPADAFYLHQREYYARYGATLSVCLNLDERFDASRVDALFQCDAIHLSGGNTYYFLHWLQRRGLLAGLRDYAEQGGVLVGISAGAILMTPNIVSCDLCGDPREVELSDVSGLGLTDFTFAPHFGTAFEMDALQTFARTQSGLVYGCPDGAGIVVDGDHVELIGRVVTP